MHESVASALYRGYERRVSTFTPRDRGQLFPGKHDARVKAMVKSISADPGVLVLGVHQSGAKKHKVSVIVLLEHGSVDQRSGWYAGLLRYSRTGLDDYDLSLFVSHHLVQRTMQRLDLKSPKAALRQLDDAIYCALWLKHPTSDSVLLPAKGGAVIAVPDKYAAHGWALVTFVDADKLRPEQRAEVAMWRERVTALQAQAATVDNVMHRPRWLDA